ncbi:MAG: sce7726 family protein [Candidatus Azobacteroides sp.]|nr:sce7726 family protein [Candidatus Azobacteroides sp.]
MKRDIGTSSAEYIKSQLIDFYISELTDNLVIGNEVMYGTKRKLVDLLILNNNELIAIEIKTDNDDLRKIEEQVKESKKIFDYIIVCTTIAHLEKIMQLLSNDIGIYSINEQGIKKIRKPQKQKKLNKAEILFSINSNFLRKNLSTPSSNINSDEIRQYYNKESINKIHNLFIDYLQRKVHSKFNLFLQHRGEFTHIDDIPLLSSSLHIQ